MKRRSSGATATTPRWSTLVSYARENPSSGMQWLGACTTPRLARSTPTDS
jgi:hypothetical protein